MKNVAIKIESRILYLFTKFWGLNKLMKAVLFYHTPLRSQRKEIKPF